MNKLKEAYKLSQQMHELKEALARLQAKRNALINECIKKGELSNGNYKLIKKVIELRNVDIQTFLNTFGIDTTLKVSKVILDKADKAVGKENVDKIATIKCTTNCDVVKINP